MKFERLILGAFGPFTDETIDLSGGGPGGFHLVYGPNEAGKSTSLRAVKALLFGFPERSVDAHTHGGGRLRVSAEISAGERRHFLTRLKKRKGDLVDIDGRTLTEDPLPELLGFLDEHSFSSRFGLDQEDLRRGAEALLGGSEEGLFSAGTAGADVRGVLAALHESSDQIYRPRGRVLPLNSALAAYDTAQRELRRSERPPEKWLEQQRAWEEKGAEAERLKSRRHEVRTELRRLNRLRAQLSDVFAWDETCRRIEEIGNVADLDEQAAAERKTAEMQVAAAEIESARIVSELKQLESDLEELPEPSLLAEVDDEQLNLSTRVGTALSARNDLPKRRAALIAEERSLAGLLTELGRHVEKGHEIEAAQGLLVQAGTRRTLGRLLTERGALVAVLAEAQKLKARNDSDITSLRALSENEEPDLDLVKLEADVAEAQVHWLKREDLLRDEVRQKELRASLARRRDELGVESPWRQLAPHVPTTNSARGAVTRYLARQQKLEEINDQIRRLRLEVGVIERELGGEKIGRLPSQAALETLRHGRDRLVKAAEDSPTPQAFSSLRTEIVRADDASDRLLQEADRVAAAAALHRSKQELSERLASHQEHQSELVALLAESEQNHQAMIRQMGLTRFPALLDAEEWCASLRALFEQEQELEFLDESLKVRQRLCEEARTRLLGSLKQGTSDDGLLDLLSIARTCLRESLEEQERRRGRRNALSKLLEQSRQIESERGVAEQALARWEDEWEGALKPLGLERSTTVHRVQDYLDVVEKLARTLGAAEGLLGRIVGMERDTASLTEDVVAIAKRHCPQLLNMDAVDAAVELQRSIRTARKDDDERRRLKSLILERKTELSHVRSKKSAGEGTLGRLMLAAGVSAACELPLVETEAAELRGLKKLRGELEQKIRTSSGGSLPSELIDEAKCWRGRVGALVDQINDLDEENQGLEDEVRLAESDCTGIKMGLDTYRSEDVALARQETERKRTEALRLLREYLVRSAAHRLLSEQVTSHAARFSGPILDRARELFGRLTLGRYTDLDVGLGERTLRCVRDKEVLEVGQLSTGTRAQLYLALRVASLEIYFDERPSVPLVFDDLLLEFDDDRATVAFEVLGELSKRVQILYFTHLARDIEAAENALDASVLFQHRIGVS